jgi:hypothetical protein
MAACAAHAFKQRMSTPLFLRTPYGYRNTAPLRLKHVRKNDIFVRNQNQISQIKNFSKRLDCNKKWTLLLVEGVLGCDQGLRQVSSVSPSRNAVGDRRRCDAVAVSGVVMVATMVSPRAPGDRQKVDGGSPSR